MHCERRPRSVHRAFAVKVTLALVIGTVGAMAPLPTTRVEHAMATETRSPVADGARVQPAPSTPPPVAAEPTDTTVPPPGNTTPGPTGAPTTVPEDASTTVPDADAATPSTANPPPSTTTTAPADPNATPPDRVRITEDTRDFDLIGVTLPVPPEVPVLVRTGTDDDVWSAWTELEFDTEEAAAPVPGVEVPQEPDDENPGAHSDPFWVGDASRYELDMAGSQADEAQVHLVYETSRQVAVAETAPAGADPRAPAILPRSSWGARPPKVTPTIASLQLAVVHHTAGTNNYSAAEVTAVLRGVQAYHMDANGWNDIGYNFAVDRFGRTWEARAGGVTNAVVGGHARGFNTNSTGVVVLGNFETASPSSAAVGAVASIIAWKFAVHDVDPRAPVAFRAGAGSPKYPPGSVVTLNRIVAHRDVGLTACPGRNLFPYLSPIRSSVASAWPQLAAPGLALVGNFAADAADDVFLSLGPPMR